VRQLEAELAAVREELRVAQEKKQEGDESFRRFSESGIVGIALFQLSGKFIYANDALLRMIGCSTEQVASKEVSWDRLTLPEWQDRLALAFDELKQHGGCAPFEAEYRRWDGTRFWALFTGIAVEENGAAFLLDITEQKKTEQTLRFQARLLDAVEQAVIATDLAGTITFWNCFAERLYGWSAEEVIGRSILDVTPAPRSREEAAAIMARLRRGESWSGEFFLQRKDGSTFPAWVTDSPIFDVAGALVGVVGVSTDITARKATEEALQTSENRFRTMFDQSPLSIQVFAPDGSHLAANPAWEKLWDTSLDQLSGYNILKDPQAKARGTLPFIERAFKGEAVAVPPIPYDPAEIGRKGRPRWIESYLYPVKDDAHRVCEVVLLLHDVTSRMEVEQERTRFVAREQEARERAEEAQRRLTFLAEASRILASSLDYQTTLDQIARLAVPILADWCDIQVLDESGVIRRVAVTHSDPAKVALAYELDRRYPVDPDSPRGVPHVLRTGEAEIYREIPDELLVAGAQDEEHLRIARELGLKSALIMPLTARGRTLGAISLVYAESGRRYTDEEIALAEDLARRAGAAIDNARLFEEAQSAARLHRTVEEKLTLLTEATGALITSLNLDRVLAAILALSRRLVAADAYAIWSRDRTTGRWDIAAAEGLSQQYQSTVTAALQHSQDTPSGPLVVTDVDQEPMLAGHRSLLQQEGIRSMLVSPLLTHSGSEGTLVFYYRSPHPFDDIELKVSGALANLAASAIATTELYQAADQRAEQLLEADRLKDQFLAMLAHELRNPLAAISNASQVIHRAQPGTPAFHRAGEVVDRQCHHMARLVDQLLDVSRIAHGKIELHPRRLDLVRLVSDTCDDHRPVLGAAGLSLVVEAPEEPLWVEGDPTRLRQALGNLLQNAAKFTPSGGTVRVRAGQGDTLGVASLAVTDTGIGIPPALLPRLFDPFVQADRSLERTQGGLGLGLALVRGIAELHGGRVHAHSLGLDHGATFTLELPLQAPPTDTDERAVPTAARADQLRVLIIEDNEDAAETLRDLLELFGHQVDVAHSGPAGVNQAFELRPDVVLCDLGLPGMDGYAVAVALRQDPATSSARLIAVTGYGQEEDQQRSAAAGFDAHLTKPVELESLQKMLE
jgi:PAS domain S-box-containing protein